MTTLAEQYFGAYLNNATNSTSTISTIANIPRDVPLETLVALSTFRPEITPLGVVQRPGPDFKIIQSKITQELLAASGETKSKLTQYTPRILSGNAIQRRRINGDQVPLTPRDRIIRGIDPKIKKLVQQLEDLTKLTSVKDKLDKLTKKLEDQINRLTALFNALVNLPDAAAAAALTVLIDKLQSLQNAYDKAKAALELVIRAYKATKKAIMKALFEDIPKAKKKLKENIDILKKILSLKEIPRIRLYPKFPKLPTVTFTKANFYAKYKKALEALKKKDGEFYQKSYAKAVEQAGFEIVDPNKDKIQRGLTQARNSLRQARAKLEQSQAIRTEAVNRARTELIQNVRNVSNSVLREQQKALTQYQNAKASGSNLIATGSSKLNNIISSGSAAISATVNQARELNNATTSAINSVSNIASTLNNKSIGAELTSGIISSAQRSTTMAASTAAASSTTSNIRTSIPADEVSVNGTTITSTTTKLDSGIASSIALELNRRKATELGFTYITTNSGFATFANKILVIDNKVYYQTTATATWGR